jgi:curved DNA-binding protein CbpA
MLMKKSLTSYDILNVDAQSSQKDIETAYKKLAMAWHPDRHAHNGKAAIADRNFKLLQQAYEKVRTPDARSLYNHQLSVQKRSIIINQNKVMNDNRPLRSFLQALDNIFGPSK